MVSVVVSERTTNVVGVLTGNTPGSAAHNATGQQFSRALKIRLFIAAEFTQQCLPFPSRKFFLGNMKQRRKAFDRSPRVMVGVCRFPLLRRVGVRHGNP